MPPSTLTVSIKRNIFIVLSNQGILRTHFLHSNEETTSASFSTFEYHVTDRFSETRLTQGWHHI